MFRRPVALFVVSALSAFAGNVQTLAALPKGTTARAIQLDTAGNIYVAGVLTPGNPKSANDTSDAFAAKLSPDGLTVLYFTPFGGSSDDAAATLAVTADGSIYVAGATRSSDFPVNNALQPIPQGFLARLDATGKVVDSTLIGGAVSAIVVTSVGDVLVSGRGEADSSGPGGFLLKLDSTLTKTLLSNHGYGGLIALDTQGNVYLAGAALPDGAGQLPTLSPDAFQSAVDSRFCAQTSGGLSTSSIPCGYQYVAKLDATGTHLLWATYITGTYGATPTGIAVDATGNVILAGTTNSDDYPVTAGAFQTSYSPAAPRAPTFGFSYARAPDATGYITKLNAAGTRLVWSTYFGGSNAEHITGLAVSPSGVIHVSGRSGSNDLPVLIGTPVPCRPQANQVLGFVARLAADGATASATQLVYGAPACLYSSCTSTVAGFDFTGWPMALRSDGSAVVAGVDGNLASLDFSTPTRLACIGDAADRAQLSAVTPGQLISVFGADLALPSAYKQPVAIMPSSETFGVFFNGLPAPILYSSGGQINVQVPYEVAGQGRVEMRLVNTQIAAPLQESRTMGVVERRPNVFLADPVVEGPIAGYSVCGTTLSIGIAPVAVNADGTMNDCSNPAAAGSTVTIFVNGLGQVTPALTTGAIAPAPAVQLTPGLDIGITTTTPGAIVGVAQVQVQLPSEVGFTQALRPLLQGVPLPEQPLIIWTRP